MNVIAAWVGSIFGEPGVPATLEAPTWKRHEPLGVDLLGGRYRLDELIGRGSSGLVYGAWDEALGEAVAIKLLRRLDGSAAQSRRDDTGGAMRLLHPGIVRVLRHDQEGDVEYLVMEYVSGVSLHRIVETRRAGHLSVREVVKVGFDVLDALQYAHDAGIPHLDIRPAHILWCQPGEIKVSGFELAPTGGRHWSPAQGGAAAFMSPERSLGEAGDARSDIYGLGATLAAIADSHAPDRLPDALGEVLVRATAKDPADRWQGCAELRRAWREAAREGLRPALSVALHLPRGTTRSAPAVLSPDEEDPPTDPDIALIEASPEPGVLVEKVPAEPEPASVVEPVPPDPAGAPTPPQESPRRARAPADLVPIPAGVLRSAYEGREVRVGELFLERDMVCCDQYAAFLAEAGGVPPFGWSRATPPRGLGDHPVTGVSLEDARRYAAWRDRRLPTATEWEHAARAPDGRAFPWGATWDAARSHGPHTGTSRTAPVGAFPSGTSPLGLRDMVGNAWEWIEPETDAPEPGYAWIYGGSWRHAGDREGHVARTSVSVIKAYDHLGFRCAVDGGRYR